MNGEAGSALLPPGDPAARREAAPALTSDARAKYLQLIEARFGLRLSGQQALLLDELVDRLVDLTRVSGAPPDDITILVLRCGEGAPPADAAA